MPKCKPVPWPRSDYWGTHSRALGGLLLSQRNEVSEVFGNGGSLDTAIYRVVVVDESGVPLLQVAASGNLKDAEADIAWATTFAGSESKWKSSSKLANAFISSWNKAHPKHENVQTVGRKTELSSVKFLAEASALDFGKKFIAADDYTCRTSHIVDYFDKYGLPPQTMRPFSPAPGRGGTSAEKAMKYAICGYTVPYDQPKRLRGQSGDEYFKETGNTNTGISNSGRSKNRISLQQPSNSPEKH